MVIGWLLNLVYGCLLLALSPWLLHSAWRKGKYREGWSAKLFGAVPQSSSIRPPASKQKTLWLHAVSVGEVKQLAVLFTEIERRGLPWQCVVSTTTKTGYDLACEIYSDKPVFYCPLDFTWAVNRALRRIRPDLLILAELELWPNLIRSAKRHRVSVGLVNGRVSEKSYRGYRRVRWLIRSLMRRMDLVAVQTPEYAERFEQLGLPVERIHVTGTLKFDGVETDRDNRHSRELRELSGIDSSEAVVMAGSTCDGEEPIVLDAFEALRGKHPELRLVVVPRHPERFDEVARLLRERGLGFLRRSELDGSTKLAIGEILLVDSIGELTHWWALASVAFVGGSLASGRGGQNMIEPAAYGAAVCFGPNTRNFRDVVEHLLAHDAASVVRDADELAAFVDRMLCDPQEARQQGGRGAEYVAAGRGAARNTVDALETILPKIKYQASPRRPAA